MPLLRLLRRARAAEASLQRAPSRWLVFGVATLALFMSAMDGTIVATGLRTIGSSLHSPINWTSWTLSGYALGLIVAMPLAGRLSDQLGRKRVFLVAAMLFTVASLCCGMATSVGVLVALRVVQAFGGAAFLPSASGIVADAFGEQRDRALGLFSSVFPLGALAGPILGGIVLSLSGWRAIFFVNVPVGIVFTTLAWRYLPSSRPAGGRADLVGAGLLGGAVLSAMLAVTHLGDPRSSPLAPGTLLPAAAAAASAFAFVSHCRRSPAPLVPLHLLRHRAFAAMNAINLVWGASAIGFGALVPVLAEDRYGMSPMAAGTLLAGRSLGEISIAALAALAIRRTGYHLPILVGMLVMAGGALMTAVPPPGVSPYLWLALAGALSGLGIGASAPAANNATIDLSPEDIGAISGLRGAVRQAGGVLGVAVVSALAARSGHQGLALAHSFAAIAVLLVAFTPLLLVVPHRRVALSERPGRPRRPAGLSASR